MKTLIRLILLAALIAAVAYYGIPRTCNKDDEWKPHLMCILETPAEEQIDNLQQTTNRAIQQTSRNRK